jgi:hypothetical protein
MGTRAGKKLCNYLMISKNLISFTSTSNIFIIHRQPNEVLLVLVPSKCPYLNRKTQLMVLDKQRAGERKINNRMSQWKRLK